MRLTSSRLTGPAVLAAFGLVALAGCSGTPTTTEEPDTLITEEAEPTEPAELTPVTVGVIPIVDVAPIYLGVEQGLFEAEGLEVTLELAQGGAAIVPAVLSGDYQFGFSNVTSLLLATAQDLLLQIVAPGNSTTGDTSSDFGAVVAMPETGIAGAADLAGRSVAVNTLNNIGDSTVRAVVEDAGGDPSAIQFTEVPFPDMPAALANGNVEAAWILEPHLTRALQLGAEVVTFNYAEVDPELMIAAYFTSADFAADNPEVVEAFTRAMQASLEAASADPEATRDALDLYTEIDPGVKEAMVMPAFPSEIHRETLTILADLAVKYGLLDAAPDTSTLLP